MEDPNKILESEAELTRVEIDQGLIGAMTNDIAASAVRVLAGLRNPDSQILSDDLHTELGGHMDIFKIRALSQLSGVGGTPVDSSRVYRLVDRPVYDRLLVQAREAIALEDRTQGKAPIARILPEGSGNKLNSAIALIEEHGLWGAIRFMASRDGMEAAAPSAHIDPYERRVFARAKELADAFDPSTNEDHRQLLLEEISRLSPSSVVHNRPELTTWRDNAALVVPGKTVTLKDRLESLIGKDNMDTPKAMSLVVSMRGEVRNYNALTRRFDNLETAVNREFAPNDATRPQILDVLTKGKAFHELTKQVPPATAAALTISRADLQPALDGLDPILNTLSTTNPAIFLLIQRVQQTAQQALNWTQVPHPLERLDKVYTDVTGADVTKAEQEFVTIAEVHKAEETRFSEGDKAFETAYKEASSSTEAAKAVTAIKKHLSDIKFASVEYKNTSSNLASIAKDITANPPVDGKDPRLAEKLRLTKLMSEQPGGLRRLKYAAEEAITRLWRNFPSHVPAGDAATFIRKVLPPDPRIEPSDGLLSSFESRIAALEKSGKDAKQKLDDRKKEWDAFKKMSYSEMTQRLIEDRNLIAGTGTGTRLLPDRVTLSPPHPGVATQGVIELSDLKDRYNEASNALRAAQKASSGSALKKNPFPPEMVLFLMQEGDPSLADAPSPQKEFRAALRTLMLLDSANNTVEEGTTLRRAQGIATSKVGQWRKSGQYRPFSEIQTETFERENELKATQGFHLGTTVKEISDKISAGSLTPEVLFKYIYQLELLARDEMEGGNLALNEDIRPLIHKCKIVYYSAKARQIVSDMKDKNTPADKATVLKKLLDESFVLPQGVSALKVMSASEVKNLRRLEGAQEGAAGGDEAAQKRLAAIERFGGWADLFLAGKGLGNILSRLGHFFGGKNKAKQLPPPK